MLDHDPQKMSPEEIILLAQEIFTAQVDLRHWDYEPVVERACYAAEAFARVIKQRYKPQSDVPIVDEPDPETQAAAIKSAPPKVERMAPPLEPMPPVNPRRGM
jgi:hypothetical protein